MILLRNRKFVYYQFLYKLTRFIYCVKFMVLNTRGARYRLYYRATLFSSRCEKLARDCTLLSSSHLPRASTDPRGVTQLIRLRRDLRFSVYADKRRAHVNSVCERPRKPEKCRDGLFSPLPLMPPDLCGSILHSTWSTTRPTTRGNVFSVSFLFPVPPFPARSSVSSR